VAAAAARAGAAASAAVTWAGAGGPLPGRRAGQRLARRELAEASFWQRLLQWLARLAQGRYVPGGWFGLVALAVLAVLALTVVIFWVRPRTNRRAAAEAVLGGQMMSARDYRRAAERHAAAGDFAAAIIDGVRAIAADLAERDVLPPRPGRTARELAAEAGAELPSVAGDLRTVASLFDDIRYGDRDGSEAGYQLVSRVGNAVRAARPGGSAAAEPVIAASGVPR